MDKKTVTSGILYISGLSVDEQNDVIERFRIGMHKCLVATSVAFEGIDIPDCNMTIRYKLDANVITSLQMRGNYISFIFKIKFK